MKDSIEIKDILIEIAEEFYYVWEKLNISPIMVDSANSGVNQIKTLLNLLESKLFGTCGLNPSIGNDEPFPTIWERFSYLWFGFKVNPDKVRLYNGMDFKKLERYFKKNRIF